jgi:UDP-N-acetylmuramoyl-tripeptide--D-alanyl-D-alanine ligase
MIPLTLAEVAAAVAGTLDGAAPDDVVTGSVITDSRSAEPGCLFVAINGERVDGHDFAAAAVAAGAVAVLAERPLPGLPTIVVTDGVMGSAEVDQPTVRALALLAHDVRARLEDTTVVALTGSSGKTSTKDLLAQVLSGSGETVAAVGSRNNEIGFPLTVLEATYDTKFLVLEMGAREIGHIKMLCDIVRPDIAMVLNVGLAHVGIFGGPDAVAVAKSEIVQALPATGVAILNADDQRTRAMTTATSARVVLFGEAPDADVRATDVQIDELARARFVLTAGAESAPVKLKVFGEHQVSNALAAAAAARAAGVPVGEIAAGLSAAKGASPMRMDVSTTTDGVVLIDDAYNANPSSMRAALKALIAMGQGRRTFAVLGEMRELGDLSISEHDAIGRLAVRLNVSQVVAVGQGARVLHLGAANEGSWDQESVWVEDAAAAIEYLRGAVRPGDVVLVKASRSIGLEVICDALRQPGFTSAAEGSRDTEKQRGAPA